MSEEHIKAFIVVGTQKFQMDRLLKEIDRIAENMPWVEFFAQKGWSTYIPRNYKYKDFIPEEEFYQIIRNSDLLIAHGGVGSITNGLKMGKPVIVVPRRVEYNEHVDNHQMEIADAFDKKGYIIKCENEMELEDKISSFRDVKLTPFVSNRDDVISYLRKCLV